MPMQGVVSQNMKKQRILVIEDNIIHITLLTEQLTVKMGVLESNITCVFDGLEAITAMHKNILENRNDPS
jgi:CheY-like chemotaxis protein